MTITTGSLKLVASTVMADVPEGGGGPTSVLIVDRESNNIFPDVSELGRALGEVNIRKVFAHVQSEDTDPYLGANFIIAEPPSDPNVSITAFASEDFFDERTDAQARLESYLAPGEIYDGYLFGDHLSGQMTMTVLQTVDARIPPIGATLVLKKAYQLPEEFTQFVRITTVSHEVRKFYDDEGAYERRVVSYTLGSRLLQNFPGMGAQRKTMPFATMAENTITYRTIVADAARYYGVVPLVEDGKIGDFIIRAKSIYTSLVPSTQVETPIADARTNNTTMGYAASGGAITQTITTLFDPTQKLFLGGAILPSSLTISRGGVTLTDKGGKLYAGETQVGAVDYSDGIATLSVAVFGGGADAHQITYTPAATPSFVTQSFGIPVTPESRRLNYVLTLTPPPARGSLSVSYLAGGELYEMRDDGSGAVLPEAGAPGVGNLNRTTGTLSVTLGVLPDDGSQVIIQYFEEVSAAPYEEGMLLEGGKLHFALTPAHPPQVNTIKITWPGDGSTKTAVADAQGVLSGDATGQVNWSGIALSPNVLPAPGTAFKLEYSYYQSSIVNFSLAALTQDPALADYWTFTIPGGAVGKVEFRVPVVLPWRKTDAALEYRGTTLVFRDKGNGTLVVASSSPAWIYDSQGNSSFATINYVSGVVKMPKVVNLRAYVEKYVTQEPIGGMATLASLGLEGIDVDVQIQSASGVSVSKFVGSAIAASESGIVPTALTLNAKLINGKLLSGVRFEHGGSIYSYTSQSDDLLKSSTGGNGVGVPAGKIGAYSGLITLTNWDAGAPCTVANWRAVMAPPTAGLNSPFLTKTVTFRTAAAPLRPSSLSVLGEFESGATFNVFSQADGSISDSSSLVSGKAGYDNGLVSLAFKQPVRPETIRYNATSYTYLPLDASIIGLDPVRLPTDGRVPIIRSGSVVVIGNTQKTPAAVVSNGQTINCARTRLSRVTVLDANGNAINTGWSANLESGQVLFTNVTGYAQPIRVEHRIEDMALVADAQISGTLRLQRPLTHDYPAQGSYVSSAMLQGNVFARVSEVFDQGSWDGVSWASIVEGESASGTYDKALAPIIVANLGALTERWALRFTSNTTFQIFGEHVGLIGTGSINVDCAPVNPRVGAPYFKIEAKGWGLGWSVGNILRIDTVAAMFPIVLVRTIQQGPESGQAYSFSVLTRGNVNRP